MKNSWISFVVLEVIVLLAVAVASPSWAAKRKKNSPEEMTNFLLSPRYSQWLVGPIAHIATPDERNSYLKLQLDEDAEAFIDEFWEARGGGGVFALDGKKVVFEERAKEADRIFSDGAFAGHRTDRGTIFVLYGEPEEMQFEEAPRGRGDFLEIWEYPKDMAEGLDGKKPERFYRFVKKDGRTVHYRGPTNQQFRGSSVRQ